MSEQQFQNRRLATGTSATILVVDDEPMVLRACRRILKREGHRVLTADGAEEACAAFEANPGEIDVLLCDVLMPQVCGGELAEKLRERDPSLEVIFISGHVSDDQTRCQIEDGRARFLGKPFAANDLLAMIGESLGH